MVENIHRAGMHDSEILAGVEQLALLGVSAAQITKRVSLPRTSVNAALSVVGTDQTRSRVEVGDLTLEQAAIYAEFESDEYAVERLDRARSRAWGDSLEHTAQRLRDEAAERQADATEVERLRAEGLPALTVEEMAEADEVLRISRLVTANGEPVPEQEWPSVPGARVHVVKEWVYPQDAADGEDDEDDIRDDGDRENDRQGDGDDQPAEPYQAYVPVWVVTDLAASGLRRRATNVSVDISAASTHDEGEAEVRAEIQRKERRRVIANNKAWTSAEVVRRAWLTGFLSRKTPPKGAEALICEAVVTGQYFLYKAMENNHPMLRKFSGVGAEQSRWDSANEVATIAAKASTPKAAIMTTLSAVVTAWEATLGKHSWRNPSKWDARILTALTEWGYQPSEVETLLLPQPKATENPDEQAGKREPDAVEEFDHPTEADGENVAD